MTTQEIHRIAAETAKLLLKELEPKKILSTAEAAEFLGVTRNYMYELVRGKKVPHYRSKGGKMLFFRKEDLINWATACRAPSKDEVL